MVSGSLKLTFNLLHSLDFGSVTSFFGNGVCRSYVFLENDMTDLRQFFFWV